LGYRGAGLVALALEAGTPARFDVGGGQARGEQPLEGLGVLSCLPDVPDAFGLEEGGDEAVL
jgi:hypothetical protein